jgi:glycogen debranching enzyme
MDTLKRDNAVEIQGLCYNALKTCERFSEAYGLKVRGRIDVSDTAEKIKESFTRAYWNGRFLNDTTQYWESSVRPNQLICASLDYSMLDRRQMADVLKVCEEKLLTEVGLRTLEQGDPRFQGRYIGNFSDRETAYHNGSVWPWLLGPYVKTYVRVHGKKGRKKMKSFLESFFRRTLSDNGLGYVNEIYDGEPPHTPRGCIAQAWSIAEPVRAYFEDALGIRPQYEKEVL